MKRKRVEPPSMRTPSRQSRRLSLKPELLSPAVPDVVLASILDDKHVQVNSDFLSNSDISIDDFRFYPPIFSKKTTLTYSHQQHNVLKRASKEPRLTVEQVSIALTLTLP